MAGPARWSVIVLALLAACTREDDGQLDRSAAREIRLVGTVAAARDGGGKLTSVTLTTRSGQVYSVALDRWGEKLGAKMDGELVEVHGIAVGQEGRKQLTVHSYQKVEQEPRQEEEATADS